MSKHLAPSGSLRRPHKPRERKKRFLIFCEGRETEPSYLSGLIKFLRSPLIEIEIGDQQGDPKGLVELAKARRNEARKSAKHAKDDSLLFDEVWCVFDVDEHTRLLDAIQQARALSIKLAISNPCFELWLLIHFQDQWAYIERGQARSAVKKCMPGYDKTVDYSLIAGRGAAALDRAEKMEARGVSAGEKHVNPSSGMWHLVTDLCEDAKFATKGL